MRNAFIERISLAAEKDKKIFLMSGDLGYGVLDKFRERFPKRFINAGISEQNMMLAACGMAVEGKTVYVYSIGNFTTMRCMEQIRNAVGYHNANVKIIAVGCGMAYGPLGVTHHATEDIAVTRCIPNLSVFSPADAVEAALIADKTALIKGPCYIRLGKGKEPSLHNGENIDVSKLMRLKSGENAAIIATGSVAGEGLKASDILKDQGFGCSVYSLASIKPIDKLGIITACKTYGHIFTLEEHNVIGGLGSAVCEIAAEGGYKAKIIRIGLNDVFSSIVGSHEYLKGIYGLSGLSVAERVLKTAGGGNSFSQEREEPAGLIFLISFFHTFFLLSTLIPCYFSVCVGRHSRPLSFKSPVFASRSFFLLFSIICRSEARL